MLFTATARYGRSRRVGQSRACRPTMIEHDSLGGPAWLDACLPYSRKGWNHVDRSPLATGSRKPAQRDGHRRGTAGHRAAGQGRPRREPREDRPLRLQAPGTRGQGADAGLADAARGLRPQLRRRALRPAAEHRRGQAHQRRPVDLQRVRLQPGEPQLLQPAQGRAAGRQPDSRHQPLDPLSDHRPPPGRRAGNGPAGPAPAHGDRTAAGLADHRPVPGGTAACLGERARPEAVGPASGEQPAARADRAAQRGRGGDQFRADDRRSPRDDEPLHPLQLHRADRRQALGQQLDLLWPQKRLAGNGPADQRNDLQLARGRAGAAGRRPRSARAS